jgi:U3 small nucleolar RNA-associated protein 25
MRYSFYFPADFRAMFEGNADDCFSVCLSFGRKNVKLFTNFYRADIIVASPLAMRLMVGAAGYVIPDEPL